MPEPGVDIAWVAHLGGFLAGLILFATFGRPPRRPTP
jgi:membrane associated rhomboid family serine protease